MISWDLAKTYQGMDLCIVMATSAREEQLGFSSPSWMAHWSGRTDQVLDPIAHVFTEGHQHHEP